MELINNYKNSENYKEEQNNELDTIEQYNSERIKKVENELKKYDIQEKTIHTLNEQYNLLKTLQIRQEKKFQNHKKKKRIRKN